MFGIYLPARRHVKKTNKLYQKNQNSKFIFKCPSNQKKLKRTKIYTMWELFYTMRNLFHQYCDLYVESLGQIFNL